MARTLLVQQKRWAFVKPVHRPLIVAVEIHGTGMDQFLSLPLSVVRIPSNIMAVVGGLVAVGVGGDGNPNELYDEGSGRWFKLPHAMVKPRHSTGLVSVPAAALT